MKDLRDVAYSISYDVDESGLKKADNVADQLADNIGKAGKFMPNFTKGLGTAKTSMQGLAQSAAGLYVADKLGDMARGVVRLGEASVMEFAKFEKGMSQVRATLGEVSDRDFVRLTASARKAGRETRFTAEESAMALNYMALAGMDATESIGAMPQVLKFASAGNIDLARSSDLVTDSMSVVNLQVSELTKLEDIFIRTSQKSNTTAEQLAEGFVQVGGVAKKFGLDLVETNTELGILANNGLKGAEGATALRNSMTRVLAPNKKNKAILRQLNIELSDGNGNYRAFNDILKDLNKNLSGYTDEQKNSFLVQLAGRENQRALNILLDNSGRAYEELSEKIYDYSGAATEAAKVQEDNVLGVLKSVQSAWSDTLIEMSSDDRLTETVKDTGVAIKEELPGIAEFGKTLVTSFAEFVNFVIDNKEVIIPIVSGLTAAFTALATAVVVLGGIAIAGALGITGPIMVVVGAIGAAVAAGVALVRNWEKIGEVGNKIKGWFGETFFGESLTGADISRPRKIEPSIPKFATGTFNTPDTFIAGENGPELVTGSPNKRVYTANDTQAMLGGGSRQMVIKPGAISISVTGNDDTLASKVEEAIENVFGTLITKYGFSV